MKKLEMFESTLRTKTQKPIQAEKSNSIGADDALNEDEDWAGHELRFAKRPQDFVLERNNDTDIIE
jgi:hypothetical protein